MPSLTYPYPAREQNASYLWPRSLTRRFPKIGLPFYGNAHNNRWLRYKGSRVAWGVTLRWVGAIASRDPQRFQERTHFRLAWRTPQVRRCLCLIAAAAALISTNEWRRGACHSRIKPLLAACVCAVGMWATRLRCPSEAAYPQPAGDSAVGSAAPGGGAGGRLNSLWISRRRRVG